MEKLKYPSRQVDNVITKFKQNNFSGGMYYDPDVPASQIPNHAVRWLYNVIAYSDYVEVRPGTKLLSNVLPPFVANKVNIVASKTGFIITKTDGADFLIQDLGRYFWWPDSRRRDLITSVLSATQVKVNYDTVEVASTAKNPAKMMREENTQRFMHNTSGKLFTLFGEKVYYSNRGVTDEWREVYLRSGQSISDRPAREFSTFDSNQNNVFLINKNGVYKIDTTVDPMDLWKSNTDCSDNTIIESPETVANAFGRRYLYAPARLVGRYDENAVNNALRIQQESGANNTDPATEYQDYRTFYGADPEVDDRVIGPMFYPNNSEHWTHLSIYSTKSLSLVQTNPAKYILIDQVSVAKAFDASRRVADGHILIGATGRVNFTPADVGNPIVFADGTADTLMVFVSNTEMEGTGVLGAVAQQGAAIGGGRVLNASQSGYFVNWVAGSTFQNSDIGKTLFWAEGEYSYIVEVINAVQVRVETEAIHLNQGATIDPNGRYYNDIIPDRVLTNRAPDWSLYQRYWQPLPQLDAGVIVPGYILVAKNGIDEIHYSQLPNGLEYLGGYYNKAFQFMPVKDTVRDIREFSDRFVVYCANRSYWGNFTVSTPVEIPEVGEFVAVLGNLNILSKTIGIMDKSSIEKLPDGSEQVVTSEPGVRICNGSAFGPNLAVDQAGKPLVLNELEKAQKTVATGYDQNKLGYMLFYSQSNTDLESLISNIECQIKKSVISLEFENIDDWYKSPFTKAEVPGNGEDVKKVVSC